MSRKFIDVESDAQRNTSPFIPKSGFNFTVSKASRFNPVLYS